MLTALVRRFVAPHRRFLVATLVLQAAQTAAGMFLPYLNADLIDHGVVAGSSGHILRIGGLMAVVTLAQVVLAIAGTYAAARLALSVGRDARAAVYASVQRLAAQDVARLGVPSLITRTTNDVQQLQMVVAMAGGIVVTAPFSCIAGIVLALRQNVRLSAVIGVAAPLLIVVAAIVIVRLQPQFALLQRRIDAINRILREQISGVRVIRAFGREDVEQRRFDEANDELTSVALIVGQRMAVVFPAVLIVSNVSSIAVLWIGGGLVDSGSAQIGTISAFLTYLTQVLTAVTVASFALSLLPRARISATRLAEVLDERPSIGSPARPSPLPAGADVRFESVGYEYPGAAAPVLSEVTLDAGPGTLTVVVGRTGSGKSTLLATLCRGIDPSTGTVRLGGVDIRRLEPAELWTRVALVPQQAQLFRGTIATNLRFVRESALPGATLTDDELWAALRVAQAEGFVRELPEALDAPVSQGGSNFSTGQRQRLCIARALLSRPAVLLLDDAFAALDYRTDSALRAALAEVTGATTVLAVSQRVGTALGADQVVMLDEGRVAGIGTHEDLLRTCAPYQQLVASQLGVAPS